MTTAEDTRAAILTTARSILGTLTYSNGMIAPTWDQLITAGCGDCSDYTHALYDKYGYTIGGMSYEQATNGIEVAHGASITDWNAIQSSVQPADLVCMAIRSGIGRGSRINHVELYAGGGMSLGHGGPGTGPTYHKITTSWLLGASTFWTVRRIIPDSTSSISDLESIAAVVAGKDHTMQFMSASGRGVALIDTDGTYVPLPNSEYVKVAGKLLAGNLQGINKREFDVAKDVARRIRAARKEA